MSQYLDIDPHGRVAPGSAEVRTALGDRAGRFEWLPSSPDLVVARRTPAGGGLVQRPRLLLAGDLSGFPIADFMAFAHQSRLTGVLHVVSGDAERSVAFKDGEVRASRSSVMGERIGEVALRLGIVTEPQLEQAMAGPKPLGKALQELGFLTSSDLWRCFHEQITAVFHAILLLRSGIFWLLDEDQSDLTTAPQAVSTEALLMDGIRRIDELSLFRARIPGLGSYLRRREPARPVSLQPVEQQLLALVDGQRTVAEVAGAAFLGEFDATKVLFHLAEAGYLEATEEPGVPSADRQAALAALASGHVELLRHRDHRRPGRASASAPRGRGRPPGRPPRALRAHLPWPGRRRGRRARRRRAARQPGGAPAGAAGGGGAAAAGRGAARAALLLPVPGR